MGEKDAKQTISFFGQQTISFFGQHTIFVRTQVQREPERSRRGTISAGTDGQEPPHGRTGPNILSCHFFILSPQELADTNESLSDLTCQNQAIQGAKMKCEQEVSVMNHDLDEMRSEAAMSEEKATRCSHPDHKQVDQLHDQVDGGRGATCRRAEKRAGLRHGLRARQEVARGSGEWMDLVIL